MHSTNLFWTTSWTTFEKSLNLYYLYNSFLLIFLSSSSFAKKLSKFSVFQTFVLLQVKILQKTKVCYIFSFSSPFSKKNSTRTNRLNYFCVSLLPFPKERRTNRLNSFVSPFSLSKRIQRTPPENSFDSSLSLKQKISKD